MRPIHSSQSHCVVSCFGVGRACCVLSGITIMTWTCIMMYALIYAVGEGLGHPIRQRWGSGLVEDITLKRWGDHSPYSQLHLTCSTFTADQVVGEAPPRESVLGCL